MVWPSLGARTAEGKAREPQVTVGATPELLAGNSAFNLKSADV